MPELRRPRTATLRRGGLAGLGAGVVIVGVVIAVQVGPGHHGPTLSVPHSLDHGRYTLVQDTSRSAGQAAWTKGGAMRDMTPAAGSYRYVSPSGQRALLDLDSGYGTVRDQGKAVRAMLGYAEDTGGDTVAVSPVAVHVAGAAQPLTCEVVASTGVAAGRVYLPLCAWADGSTAGVVSGVDYTKLAKTAADVDLQGFAALTATVRQEIGAG